jgi:hypothetical protein
LKTGGDALAEPEPAADGSPTASGPAGDIDGDIVISDDSDDDACGDGDLKFSSSEGEEAEEVFSHKSGQQSGCSNASSINAIGDSDGGSLEF